QRPERAGGRGTHPDEAELPPLVGEGFLLSGAGNGTGQDHGDAGERRPVGVMDVAAHHAELARLAPADEAGHEQQTDERLTGPEGPRTTRYHVRFPAATVADRSLPEMPRTGGSEHADRPAHRPLAPAVERLHDVRLVRAPQGAEGSTVVDR